MIKEFSTLLLLATSSQAFAQTNEELLFQKVFGKKKAPKSIEVPSYFEGLYVGDIKVTIANEKVQRVSTERIKKTLFNLVNQEIMATLSDEENISVESLKQKGILLRYLPEEFKLIITVDVNIRRPEELSLDVGIPPWAEQAMRPQNHSAIINYDITYDIANNEKASTSKIRADLNPSYNFRSTTLESFHFYESDDKKWKRSDTRFIWNEPKNTQSITVGDLNYGVIGYQSYRTLLGINWNRNFSLNPYKTNTPDEREVVFLDERSLVKIYINGRLIRASFFNAGKHILNGLPLETGINDVRVEVKGNSGKEQVYNFTKTSSTELLSEGLIDYNLAVGIPSDDTAENKKYLKDEGLTTSFYYGKGIKNNLTAKGYTQFDKKQYLAGVQGLYSHSIGIFSLSSATSYIKENKNKGMALKLNYEKSTNYSQKKTNYRFVFGSEYLSKEFAPFGTLLATNNISNIFSTGVNFSFPSSSSVGVNFSYGLTREDTLNDKFQTSISFATRITRSLNFNSFYMREKNEFNNWATTIYAFLTYSIPESNQYLSSYYDYPSETKRITWSKTNSEQINSLNSDISISDNNEESDVEARFDYRSSIANMKVSHRHRKNNDKSESDLTKLNLKGSMLFTKKGIHAAPPVDGSFAIVSPNKYLKGQKIGVRSTSGFNEGENLFGNDIVITNLTPYNYRLLTLDTSSLTPGHTIKKEQIALYPKYKSGHLIEVGEPGQAVLEGKIVIKGTPYKLKTGALININTEESFYFFTGTRGQFLVEGITAGTYEMTISGYNKKIPVKINADQTGSINLGQIDIK